MFYGMGAIRAQMKAAMAEASAATAKDQVATTGRQVRNLEKELDRLELPLEAQWSLLCELLEVDDDMLRARVQQIDLQDGVLDGKVTRNAMAPCPACARPTPAHKPTCIYCGVPVSGMR